MSNNVVSFLKEPGGGTATLTGRVRCVACKHEWIAIQETTVPFNGAEGDLECPVCGCARGQWKWPFKGPSDEEVWTCRCDSQFFMITRQGTRCIGCGVHAIFHG